MKTVLENGAFMPKRAHPTDAGLDLRAKEGQIVPANGSAVFPLGVHIALPPNTAGLIVSKSGLHVNHGITSTGLIDEGYTGELIVKLFNHSKEDYEVHTGDKISQLVIINVRYEEIELVDELPSGTERGDNGFGSTGV